MSTTTPTTPPPSVALTLSTADYARALKAVQAFGHRDIASALSSHLRDLVRAHEQNAALQSFGLAYADVEVAEAES